MKKTLNINLAGYPFTIDEDAYNLLKDYLDTIRFAFDTKEDTEDLAADIEARISEILLENERGEVRIITFDEISKVIERIGRPSEFIEIEVESEDNAGSSQENGIREEAGPRTNLTPPPYSPAQTEQSLRKKLFRDPQNSMLGGVCSGLAAYLNLDVTIVRLMTVVLFFLSATTVALAYIILWIVVPEANTPLQRMQMMGQNPTMENIGKTVKDNYRNEDAEGSNTPEKSGFQKSLSSALSIFVKCLVILGLLIGIPVLIAISAAILGCVIAVFVISIGIVGGGMFDSVNEGLMVLYILLAVIGGAITVGVPLWLLIRMAFKKKDTNLNSNTRKSLLIIWLAGIALVAVFSVKAAKKAHSIDYEGWRENIENFEILNELDGHDIEDIKVKKNKIIVTTKEGTKYKIEKGVITIDRESSHLQDIQTVEETEQAEKTKQETESASEVTLSDEIVIDSIN